MGIEQFVLGLAATAMASGLIKLGLMGLGVGLLAMPVRTRRMAKRSGQF